jgi:hypothetical protein
VDLTVAQRRSPRFANELDIPATAAAAPTVDQMHLPAL